MTGVPAFEFAILRLDHTWVSWKIIVPDAVLPCLSKDWAELRCFADTWWYETYGHLFDSTTVAILMHVHNQPTVKKET